MRRELLSFPHIDSYPAMLFLGFLSAYLLARWRARRSGVEGRHIDNLTLLFAILGLAGARFFSWMFYQPAGASLAENFRLWGNGGLVFYGGVIAALAGLVAYCAIARLPLLQLTDIYAAPLALGLGFGRVGCFLAGCCWGGVCWPAQPRADIPPAHLARVSAFPALSPRGFLLAVRFPSGSGAFEQHQKLGLLEAGADRSLPVHPVQLYEAAGAFALALFLHRRFRLRRRAGEITALCGLGYAVLRLAMELVRADNPRSYLGLTISQVISLVIGLFCLGLLFRLSRTVDNSSTPSTPALTSTVPAPTVRPT